MPAVPANVERALEEARELGFLGPGPLGPHLEHAVGFDAALRHRRGGSPPPVRAIDLGSGGGLPGLVLAALWPETGVVLLEAAHRRAEFLRRAVLSCAFGPRVEVVEARAEVAGRDPALRASIGVAVARSFAAPGVVSECAAPFLAVGGLLVVSEPPDAERSGGRWPPEGLSRLGLRDDGPYRASFGYRVLVQEELTSDRYPRRTGVPTKRPLF